MKITVTGSLGHISRPLVQKLISAGHDVIVVSSSKERKDEIKELGASPAIGSVEDVTFLTKTFTGADAIYTMVPPNYQTTNWKQYIAGIGENYAKAIAEAGVKYVVNLSSIGAHLPEGAGPVSGAHFVERALDALEGVNIKHLRPASFYTNYYGNVQMIEQFGIIGANYGADTQLVLVDVNDIAEVAFQELDSLSFTGKSVRYIASDKRTAQEVATVLGRAIGKPELPWVSFSDEDLHAALLQNGFGEDIAANFVELGKAVREGRLSEEYREEIPAGTTRIEEFAKVYAKSFNSPVES